MVLMPLSLSASMMRWKPSVISRSASPEGFSCTAASDIVLSRDPCVARLARALSANPRASFLFEHDLFRKPVPTFRDHALVQVVGVFRHVLGKAERVRAYQLLGAGGVARLQRLDDVHVIVNRAVGAILLADRLH